MRTDKSIMKDIAYYTIISDDENKEKTLKELDHYYCKDETKRRKDRESIKRDKNKY